MLRHRPRLVIATLLGLLLFFLLPGDWPAVSRLLYAWNAGVWGYLASMAWHMARASRGDLQKIAEQEDASTVATLAVLSVSAVLSLAAIVAELASTHGASSGLAMQKYGLTVLSIIGSWLLVGVIYTVHYTHLFYKAQPGQRPLAFPDGIDDPTYADFLYFAFTISVAAQTSDIAILTRQMRIAVLAQSVLSFFFNAAILGLTINIAAGLVGQYGR